jgi:DNA-binding response OmpR family regulator
MPHDSTLRAAKRRGYAASSGRLLGLGPALRLQSGHLGHIKPTYSFLPLARTNRKPVIYLETMRILVVEDDQKLASFLGRVLTEEGFSVDRCSTGADAIAQARTGAYELAVLDWMIPDLDGLEVCRQLRREGIGLPILMLTARDQVRERVLALDAGADDYMVKPFEIEELVARIHALLRRAQGHARLKLGSLEIDRAQRRALLDNTPLDLTTREMTLLLHLANRVDRVVTRSELLTQVWSIRFDPESNVVEVHISRLRDKLGKYSWMIETVRGRGYRMRARRSD